MELSSCLTGCGLPQAFHRWGKLSLLGLLRGCVQISAVLLSVPDKGGTCWRIHACCHQVAVALSAGAEPGQAPQHPTRSAHSPVHSPPHRPGSLPSLHHHRRKPTPTPARRKVLSTPGPRNGGCSRGGQEQLHEGAQPCSHLGHSVNTGEPWTPAFLIHSSRTAEQARDPGHRPSTGNKQHWQRSRALQLGDQVWGCLALRRVLGQNVSADTRSVPDKLGS